MPAAQPRPLVRPKAAAAPARASIGGALKSFAPPPWLKKIKDMNQPTLFATYGREAVVHRDLIVGRAPVPSTWRSFRQFMLDVGPAPEGDNWILSLVDDSHRGYEPGKVRWAKAADPLAFYWKKDPGGVQGEWNRSPIVEDPAEPVLQAGPEVDEESLFIGHLVEQWLPADPEKRAAFKQAFHFWRMQVKPAHRAAAKPAFLFLYSTCLVLKDLRNQLITAGLWDAHTARQDERDRHPAWGRYCEHLMRAEAALSSLPEFNGYSLYSDLDKLIDRLMRTERKYRMA